MSPPARDRILNAATRLFRLHGMAGTGLSEILAASDTGKSQLYHYFGSKQGLIDAVLERHRAEEVERIRRAFDGVGAVEGLGRWFDALQAREEEVGYRGGDPIASMAAEATEDDPGFQERLATAFDDLLDALAAGLESGAAGGSDSAAGAGPASGRSSIPDPLGAAMRILLLTQGGLMLASTLKEPAFLEEARRAAIDTLRSGPTPVTPQPVVS